MSFLDATLFPLGILIGIVLCAAWHKFFVIPPLTRKIEHYKERAEYFGNLSQSRFRRSTDRLEGSI